MRKSAFITHLASAEELKNAQEIMRRVKQTYSKKELLKRGFCYSQVHHWYEFGHIPGAKNLEKLEGLLKDVGGHKDGVGA